MIQSEKIQVYVMQADTCIVPLFEIWYCSIDEYMNNNNIVSQIPWLSGRKPYVKNVRNEIPKNKPFECTNVCEQW